jgi:hypothetical protein
MKRGDIVRLKANFAEDPKYGKVIGFRGNKVVIFWEDNTSSILDITSPRLEKVWY